MRVRKKVMGRTKTEVREKLRELHAQVDSGVRPRRHYPVGDALDDWLAHGPSTYRNAVQSASRSCGKVVHVLARVLECPDDAVADRAALGGEGGDRGQRPLAELAVGLVHGVGRNPSRALRVATRWPTATPD